MLAAPVKITQMVLTILQLPVSYLAKQLWTSMVYLPLKSLKIDVMLFKSPTCFTAPETKLPVDPSSGAKYPLINFLPPLRAALVTLPRKNFGIKEFTPAAASSPGIWCILFCNDCWRLFNRSRTINCSLCKSSRVVI